MVIDITDVTPLFIWLLGPEWTEGRLFHPLPLTVFLLLLIAGLSWLVVRLRKGHGSTDRGAARAIGGGSAAAIVLIALGIIAWKLLLLGKAEEIAWTLTLANFAEGLRNSCFKGLQWLLGSGWHQGALYWWFLVIISAAAAVFVLGWLAVALRRGPIKALETSGRAIGDCALDIIRISPRRVGALAGLGIKESIRRRVVVVFAVFILILLFAGWFLDPGSIDPARLYLNFVLTTTGYLVILLLLFLSSLSLPADIKSRTLHTIVTKPVRSSEVVLGRIAGFTAVATCLLLIMGVISYFFVERGLAHTHKVDADSLKTVEYAAGRPTGRQGLTTRVHEHRHKVVVDPSGNGRVEMEQGHRHDLKGDWKELLSKESAGKKYQLGQPEGMLLARVPVYGKLTFRDREGKPTDKGINVGDEWTYRSYIEGGSLAAAVWTFQGITEKRFPAGLPVDMILGIFRTHKGNIEKGVTGSLLLRNPRDGSDVKPTEVEIFESKEFQIDNRLIPREVRTPDGKKVDLFKEFVSDGEVEIWLRCVDMAQYFGVAQADMYLRAHNASFAWNFAKGYFGIWLLGLLVITLGVLFSTFLSGPVAVLATFGALLGGLFHDFMFRLATHQTYGGGPFESIVRILTQQNVTSEMEPGLRTTVVQTLDQPAAFGLWLLAAVLPDLSRFNVFSKCVAYGFNIPGDTILTYTCRTFAFVLPLFVAAYLCLKNREVAR